MVISSGIKLEIYDRQSDSGDRAYNFPEKYNKYIKDKIPFTGLGEVYKYAKYAININTVKNSDTMFARRIFEVMACGCIVISNESKGLKNIFQNRIWFLGEAFDHSKEEDYRAINAEYVRHVHTCGLRLEELIAKVKD